MPIKPSHSLSTCIHILGASGSGTSTLGAALAAEFDCPQFDVDSYFWLPTDPPFQTSRERAERLRLLSADLDKSAPWVVSGSLCDWGDPLIARFTLVVFLVVPTAIRLRRLRTREVERYGDLISPKGSMFQTHCAFMEWAGQYDAGDQQMRSRKLHEAWLADLNCPVLRLEGDLSTADQLHTINSHLVTVRR